MLNTFDEVADLYARVKPLRGKHKPDDVRPIGKRSRKTERVVKIDDNTYLLTDSHWGDPVFTWWGTCDGAPRTVSREEQIMLAPIVWRRHPDGSETVTVRNASGVWGQHNGRYDFLWCHLPRGLTFCMKRNGEHYISRGGVASVRYSYQAKNADLYGNKHYLSLSKTLPRYVVEDVKRRVAENPNNYYSTYLKWMTTEDDGAALTFKRLDDRGSWEFIGGGRPRIVELPRVKKDEKAAYKDKIAAFVNYCFVMRPLMEISYNQQHKMNEAVKEWQEQTGRKWAYWRNMTSSIPADIAREALDPEHPLYLPFAYNLMMAHLQRMPETKEQLAHVRAGVNRWLNKVLGFTTKVIEERE